jgi:ribosomal protein S18 acetylase RimI-like enzyme
LSLYADYIREREGIEVIELENDLGFFLYTFIPNNICYILDIYVKPEHRRNHIGISIYNKLEVIAKERGCIKIQASIIPSKKNSTFSLNGALANGYKLISTQNDYILVSKDI